MISYHIIFLLSSTLFRTLSLSFKQFRQRLIFYHITFILSSTFYFLFSTSCDSLFTISHTLYIVKYFSLYKHSAIHFVFTKAVVTFIYFTCILKNVNTFFQNFYTFFLFSLENGRESLVSTNSLPLRLPSLIHACCLLDYFWLLILFCLLFAALFLYFCCNCCAYAPCYIPAQILFCSCLCLLFFQFVFSCFCPLPGTSPKLFLQDEIKTKPFDLISSCKASIGNMIDFIPFYLRIYFPCNCI